MNRILQAVALAHVPVALCGTCMDARGLKPDERIDGAHRGTLDELAEWTAWAEKVLIF